jgi:uncharacterized FlaG/YvyC family protein
MNQSSIKPISGVQPSEGNALSKSLSSAQAEIISQQSRLTATRHEKAQVESKNEDTEIGSLANVSVHFRVDEKTNEVTVFLVDRKSKKVLRSIPASELHELQIGDLLKLTG